MSGRPYVLAEATLEQLRQTAPRLAVLPWGATEAHGRHLPHGTDCIEAEELACRAAGRAVEKGAAVVVLPVVPFGNNAQQLDQVATISFSTPTAVSVLDDVCASLKAQHIDRLLIVNGHGGNAFAPLVRDAQRKHEMLIVVAEFWRMVPQVTAEVFDDPGDHAGQMETSLMLHLRADLVQMERAGDGRRVPFDLESLTQPGLWTPRPWSACHPDGGCGDGRSATAEKGRRFAEAVVAGLAQVMVELAGAQRGQLPYL